LKKAGLLYWLLIASAFTSGLRFDISGGQYGIIVNWSQIICLMLFGKMIVIKEVKVKSSGKSIFGLFDLIVLLYLLSNVFSSLLYSSDVQSIKTCITMFSYLFIYYITKIVTYSLADEKICIDLLHSFNNGSMIVGIVGLLLSLSGIMYENIGITFDNFNGLAPSIRSLSYEPNLFASITAIVGVFTFSSLINGDNKYKRPFLVLLLIMISIMLSFTRTVYFSLPLVLIIASLLFSSRSIKVLLKFSTVMLLVIIIFKVFFSGNQGLDYIFTERIAGMFDFDSGSGAARVLGYEIAMNSFSNHPIIGNGTNTAQTETFNQTTGQIDNIHAGKGYLSGAWIQSLHDTGILGFIIIILLFVLPIFQNYKAFKSERDIRYKSMFLAFFMGNIIIAITSQMTSALFISFPWIYWGLNFAIIDKYKNNKLI
jgi:O-antigen ligase